jgi:outer membrane receptor protein involved in Fe transport
MVNYEAGIIQKLLKNKLTLELTGFHVSGDNMIITVLGNSGPRNENSGNFSNTGIEFASVFKPFDNLSFNANYSYISLDEPVLASPKQQLFIGGTYTWNKLVMNISLQHIQDLYTQIDPEKRKESYTLLNSRISYTFNKVVDIFVKGENLTDQKYYINNAYPMPGIIAFGGVNLHF